MSSITRSFRALKVNLRTRFWAVPVVALAPVLCVAEGYVPSPAESALLDLMMQDDIRSTAEGQWSYAAITQGVTRISADEMARTYAVGGFETGKDPFEGRRFLVSGTVASALDYRQGRAFVVFADTGSVQVRAQPQANNAVRTLALRTGDKVALVCTGAGGTKVAGVLRDCEFGDDFGKRVWVGLRNDFSEFYRGKPAKSLSIVSTALGLAGRASQMPADSGCGEDAEKCVEAAVAVGPLKGKRTSLEEALQRFGNAGLDLSLFSVVPIDSN